jgi:hypothetical protein
VTGVNLESVIKDEKLLVDAFHQKIKITGGKIGPADAVPE